MSLKSLMLICESILQGVRERAAGKQKEKTETTLSCVPAQLCGLAGRTCFYSHGKDNRIHKTNQYSVIYGMIHHQDVMYVLESSKIHFIGMHKLGRSKSNRQKKRNKNSQLASEKGIFKILPFQNSSCHNVE